MSEELIKEIETDMLVEALKEAIPCIHTGDRAVADKCRQALAAYSAGEMVTRFEREYAARCNHRYDRDAIRFALRAAIPLPKEAYVAATLDEFGGATTGQKTLREFRENLSAAKIAMREASPTPTPVEAKPVLHAIIWPDAEAKIGYVPFVSGGTKSEPLYSQASLEALQAYMDMLIACVARHTQGRESVMDRTYAEALRITEDHLKRLGWKFTPSDVAVEARKLIDTLGLDTPQ